MRLTGRDITELYDRHAPAILTFFARRTYAPDVAVDLLAETFATAFEDRDQFRGGSVDAAAAWLFAIARHRLSDYFRRGHVERRALGRPATALVHTRDTVRTELFFDPATAASLAARLTTTEPGTTTQTWLYTPPTTVESVDTRP